MNTEAENRAPEEQMQADRAAYDWLKRELSQYCDRVLEAHKGASYTIACEWIRGRQRLRWAAPVELRGEDCFSLNQAIADGHISRNDVVRSYTKRRPAWR